MKMEEWKECTLSDLGTIVGGATPSTKDSSNYENGSIAWITPKDLSTHTERFIAHGERNITEKGLKSCSAQLMPPNSILFTSRAPIGYIAIAKNEVCTNQGFKSIVPNKDTDFMFLYYLLRYNKDNIENLGSGTTFKEVSGSTMRNVPVKLPPLPTQQKIAAILSSLDDKIELNNKINTNLEQQAQALFKNWFVDFEPFGGKIPEGWKEKPLYDYATFINGTSFKEDEYDTKGVPIIKIAELKNGITDATQYFNGEKDPKYDVVNGDILFSWSGNPETSIDIFIWSLGNGILNQHTFNVKSNTNRKWFTYCLLKYFKPEFCHRAACKQTTGLGHVTANDLKQITFCSGEKEESNFEALISPIMSQIFNNKIENQKLVSIRDTLLPKLMNGEIET